MLARLFLSIIIEVSFKCCLTMFMLVPISVYIKRYECTCTKLQINKY